MKGRSSSPSDRDEMGGMPMQSNVLTLVEQALPTLRPAERRIARLVLDSPSVIRNSTISKLADTCGTSSTTVTRFVGALGFSGYPDFRMAVSTAIAREEAQLERFSAEDSDINPNDSADQVVAKIVFQETTAIEQTASALDLTVIDRVVAAINTADRIDLFGVASSGLAAQDLQQKLHRIGLISYAWLDPHLALTSAALLSKRSVAIAFSHSGLTVETIDTLRIAAESGALTVAVTNFPDSPLANVADLTLTTAARETRFRSGAMSSRIAQFALVDFLFVRIAQLRFDQLGINLSRTREAIQSHRLTAGQRNTIATLHE